MPAGQYQNTKEDYRRARALRNDASPFERKVWDGIRALSKMRKLKFRRQHAVHPYIADFACLRARLLIELDGCSHDARQGYDATRDADLRKRGFHILRFRNEDVAENLDGVVDIIFDTAERLIREREERGELRNQIATKTVVSPSPCGKRGTATPPIRQLALREGWGRRRRVS